jgi:Mg/Co/Ni transporter MgtE
MISNPQTGGSAAVLLNAEDKFNTLTENDEYMFDEDKNTQAEIKDIKKLLNRIDKKQLKALIKDELSENSPFVYTALDYSDNIEAIKELLRCDNQTIILKTAEVLKKLGALNDTERTVALLKITDENIKSILRAL